MRHCNSTIVIWMLKLVMGSAGMHQNSAIGFKPGDDVTTCHHTKIHTIANRCVVLKLAFFQGKGSLPDGKNSGGTQG